MIRTELFWENETLDLSIEESVWGKRSNFYDKLIKYFPNDAKILDIGCGDGRNSIHLALLNRDYQITAVDISENSIKRFEERIDHFQTKNITLICSDILDIDFEEEFDVIIAQGIVHFIEKYQHPKLFGFMNKWTKSGGFNFVSDITNLIDYPYDICDTFLSSIGEEDLIEIYQTWNILFFKHHLACDAHMGNTIFHKHDIVKIFAQKNYV